MADRSIRLTVDKEAIAALATEWQKAFTGALEALREIQEAARQTEAIVRSSAVEPWTFYSAAHECNLISYLDDRNQVRHVPDKSGYTVPESWRRLYVEKKA
jgi:hypothetical protein